MQKAHGLDLVYARPVLAALKGISISIGKSKKEAQKNAKSKAKSERQKKYEWVLMNGKQVRIKRPQLIDGMLVEEFIAQNTDPTLKPATPI